jgi:GTP-binding protein
MEGYVFGAMKPITTHQLPLTNLVAIVGRPNVGKSALFNRIVGRRIAIVHAQPGVTRDRISAEVEWRGRTFTLVDTGGIGLMRGESSHDKIVAAARQQVDVAVEAASLIIFTGDVRDGVTPLDEEIARMLRTSGKSVLVAVNKTDNRTMEEQATGVFSTLGFEKLFPVSAIQGLGVNELLDEVVSRLPSRTQTLKHSGTRFPTRIAVVGRPNVGKSSLINALLNEKRVIVSEIPGTTRDAVDIPFSTEADGVRRHYVLIDTAGIRPTRKIPDSVDFFSVKRAEQSIERCDLALLILDAEMGVTAQDKKIGGQILDAKKGCLIVVNKWDLIGEPVQRKFIEGLKHILFFLDFAPVIFISAKTGFALPKLLDMIRFVQSQMQQDIATPILNRVLHDAIEMRPPPSRTGLRMKFFYAVHEQKQPHRFVLFVNRTDLFTAPYQKYLADALRKQFGFEGCPLLLHGRNRPKTIEPRRGGRR